MRQEIPRSIYYLVFVNLQETELAVLVLGVACLRTFVQANLTGWAPSQLLRRKLYLGRNEKYLVTYTSAGRRRSACLNSIVVLLVTCW